MLRVPAASAYPESYCVMIPNFGNNLCFCILFINIIFNMVVVGIFVGIY